MRQIALKGQEGARNIERKNPMWELIFLYTFLLLSGNLVGDSSLHIFYFTFSSATLLFQFVYAGTIIFTETIGFKKTIQIVWLTAVLNLAMAFLVYHILHNPLPNFWVSQNLNILDPDQRLYIIFMFSIGYACSTLAMILVAGILKIFLKHHWLFMRVLLVTLAGMAIDMAVLFPVIQFATPDTYMLTWKMLALLTVKLVSCIFAVPLTYLAIIFVKKRIPGMDL